jgi:hypothetical protein
MSNSSGLAAYRDLVFSPLALPPPPVVEPGPLVSCMRWACKAGRALGRDVAERGYEARAGRRYPWLSAVVGFGEASGIERSFEREFPGIVEYCGEFPVNGPGWLTLLAQRGRTAIFPHADADGRWVLRFYLHDKSREGLHFYMAREGVSALPRGADDWSSLVELGTKHYARWPRTNTPYCLNSVRAAHAVDANACALGERIACLLAPANGYREGDLFALLERSTARYRRHQIWYASPRARSATARSSAHALGTRA